MLLSAEINDETDVIWLESELDAFKTFVLVVVIPELAVAIDDPSEDDALSTEVLVLVTFVLTPAIELPSDDDAPSTVPLTVEIWLESELDAPRTKLLVPVIAERIDEVAVAIRESVLAFMLVSISVASVPKDVRVREPNVHTSDAVKPPLPTVLTGTFKLSTINLPIEPSVVNDEVAAFHTSVAERLFNAAIRAPMVDDAERTLLLIVESVFPRDDELFKMFVLAVVT